MGHPIANGPSYAEMAGQGGSGGSPGAVIFGSPLAWRRAEHTFDCALVPSEMTGTTTPIVVLTPRPWPLGTHQTGVAWAMLLERSLADRLPGKIRLAPADDFAAAAAFVATKLGIPAVAAVHDRVRPEVLSDLEKAGAAIERIPGDESAVVAEAKRRAHAEGATFLDPAQDFAAYRFHTNVTAPNLLQLAKELVREHVGRGRIDALIGGFDDPAALAAGARIKEISPETRIAAADDLQLAERWTQSGDATRAWPLILAPDLVDAVVGVDHATVLGYWQLLAKHPKLLVEEGFVPMEQVESIVEDFSFSTMQRLFAAVKMARARHFTHENLIVVLSPAALPRDRSALEAHVQKAGKPGFDEAVRRIDWLRETDAAGVFETTPAMIERRREQHRRAWAADGRDAAAYDAEVTPEGWRLQRDLAADIDRRLLEQRT